MTPDAKTHYSLLCETSYSEFKPVDGSRIVDDTITGLVNAGLIRDEDRKDIVDTWVYHAKYSYPTPSVERDGILAQAIPFLERHDIYSRGRFGMWKYEVSNTDHTLMQGVELVNRLVLGEPETTIGIKYESTLDGRQAATHERSHHAGSGDPKRVAAASAPAGATAKASPDAAAPAPARLGMVEQIAASIEKTPVKPAAPAKTVRSARPVGAGGPGDKAESHISEEELGVTQPDRAGQQRSAT